MLGFYENFPRSAHRIDNFRSVISTQKLQQKLIQVLNEINGKKFSFEEVANPTVPECIVIFEVGIADAKSFNYIDDEETSKTLNVIKKEPFRIMDFFCVVRYYREIAEKKSPLRFDYYMIRLAFNRDLIAVKVFHERGPRYISPGDITTFIVGAIDKKSKKKIMRPLEPD